MAFDKTIPSQIAEYELYDVESTSELMKVASSKVDLPEGFEFDSDFLYMWIRIISAGEYYGPNKNGDYFPEEELIHSYGTFNQAHVFKNHENKKIEKAIGQIISVRWNPVMKCVEIFKSVDKKLAPEIVRGFLKGYLTDVSMGCKVPYTVCSVCGNKARKQTEFCNHVKNYRMQFLGDGERVFEINYDPKFHDSSVVLNGAERVAKAMMIIEAPEPGSAIVSSFQKAASVGGATKYVRLTDYEMDKVASHNETLHPLLRSEQIEKVASENPWMDKIAELEKEVTGKILNIVSSPSESKPAAAEQFIQIVKFLTEKRLGEDNLSEISKTLNELSQAEDIPVSRVFSTFIGVAEMMGIELFPAELHTILTGISSARFDRSLETSESDRDELFPGEFAKGMKKTLAATEQLPEFNDTSGLFDLYDEVPHQRDLFTSDPMSFFDRIGQGDDLDTDASTNVVKIIRNILNPIVPMRSFHSEHLFPRLAVVLTGHRPIIGDSDAGRDFDILANPKTLGDVLASLSYQNYQKMRPGIHVTRLVKTALFYDGELEKIASRKDDRDMIRNMADIDSGPRRGRTPTPSESKVFVKKNGESQSFNRPVSGKKPEWINPTKEDLNMIESMGGFDSAPAKQTPGVETKNAAPSTTENKTPKTKAAIDPKDVKGIKRRHIAAVAIPAIYGASMFQKNREKEGRNLSDVESFIANRPDVISSGIVLGGKPLSAAVARASLKTKDGVVATGARVKNKAQEITDKTKENFEKLTSEEYEGLVKVADSYNSGQFNSFNNEFLSDFASSFSLTSREAASVKLAALLSLDGMEKEAAELLDHANIIPEMKGVFLKMAAEYTSEEMEKAANDFVNNIVLDSLVNQQPFANALPGRVVDAFVFKKIGDMVSNMSEQKQPSISNKAPEADNL